MVPDPIASHPPPKYRGRKIGALTSNDASCYYSVTGAVNPSSVIRALHNMDRDDDETFECEVALVRHQDSRSPPPVRSSPQPTVPEAKAVQRLLMMPLMDGHPRDIHYPLPIHPVALSPPRPRPVAVVTAPWEMNGLDAVLLGRPAGTRLAGPVMYKDFRGYNLRAVGRSFW